MKYRIACITVVTITNFTAFGETPFEREFKQLREQRDKLIAAAAEPINRKYQVSLDQLLRRATQGNDLDTALKIKQEMATPTATPTPSSAATSGHKPTKRQIEKLLTEGNWLLMEHANSPTASPPPNAKTIFTKDGNLRAADGRMHQWRIEQDGTVKLLTEAFDRYGLELIFLSDTETTVKRVGNLWPTDTFTRFVPVGK